MRNYIFTVLLSAFIFMGCSSTASIYEKDDLITIAHNSGSEYTLLIYRSAQGRTRKVLRKQGICELFLMETDEGEFVLKERGQEPKKLSAATIAAVEAKLDELVYGIKAPDAVVGETSSL